MIYIDSNEPPILFEVFEEAGIEFKKERLVQNEEQVADITDKKTFWIERKTEGDFWSSMVDSRLYDQFRKLSKLPGWKIVILEGFLSNIMMAHPKNKKWVRSMRWVAMQYGVHLIQVDDIYELVKEVQMIASKAGKEPKMRLRKQIVPKDTPTALKMIASYPGMGIKRGHIALKTTGSLRNFTDLFFHEREYLLQILKENNAKIGNGILDKITNAFDEKYND